MGGYDASPARSDSPAKSTLPSGRSPQPTEYSSQLGTKFTPANSRTLRTPFGESLQEAINSFTPARVRTFRTPFFQSLRNVVTTLSHLVAGCALLSLGSGSWWWRTFPPRPTKRRPTAFHHDLVYVDTAVVLFDKFPAVPTTVLHTHSVEPDQIPQELKNTRPKHPDIITREAFEQRPRRQEVHQVCSAGEKPLTATKRRFDVEANIAGSIISKNSETAVRSVRTPAPK